MLTIVRFVRQATGGLCSNPKSVAIAGWRGAGPIVAAAGALAGEALACVAADTQGFRFGKLPDYRDPMFLPGGAKYLDLPGLLALHAPRPLWLAGEGPKPAIIPAAYRAAPSPDGLEIFTGDTSQQEAAAGLWLLK